MRILINKSIFSSIIVQGIGEYPREACGILGGERGNFEFIIKEFYPAKNIAFFPEKEFFINPIDEIRIFKELDKKSLEFVGIYHTHPEGELYLSERDIEKMLSHICYIVISLRLSNTSVSLGMKAYFKKDNEIIDLPINFF
ncbi:MAG: Mov34/MPN/PAD-1 family protein [Dictyoglomus sp.]